jgi:hypothetical protein
MLVPSEPLYPQPVATRNYWASLSWLLLFGVGALVVGIFVARGGSGLFGEWYGGEFCLVDANHDNALDVFGFAGDASEPSLVVVDGTKGSRLFSGEALPSGTQLTCAGPGAVLTHFPDFRVRAFGPDTKPIWEKRLSDRSYRIDVIDGCALFHTSDQEKHWLRVSDGAPCEAPRPAEPEGYSPTSLPTSTVQDGNTLFLLKVRERGTPVLTLRAESGGQTLWEHELNLKHPSRSGMAPILAMDRGVIVVAGDDLADDDYLVLVGFDAKSGQERYRYRQHSHWSGNVFDWKHDGPRLFLQWGYGMHAYHIESGERGWFIGGR